MISTLKKNEKVNAIISIALIICMTFYYFILIGVTTVTYASVFSRDNVSFETFFKDGEGNRITEIDSSSSDDLYLYLGIQVLEEGFFNGKVSIENSNFEIDASFKDDKIQSIDGNTLLLNQINNGSPAEIKVKIKMLKKEQYDLNLLSKETKLVMQGTYTNSVAEKNIELSSIVKVNYKSPYTNKEKDTFDAKLISNKIYKVNNENKRIVQILLGTKLTGNNYPVEQNNIEVNVPNGVEDVKVYSRGTYLSNGENEREFQSSEWNYDKNENTLKINLKNTIQTGENGESFVNWKQDSIDSLIITYILPEIAEFSESLIASSEISLYDGFIYNDLPTIINSKKEIAIKEEKDGIINGKVSNEETTIYKGKLYAKEDRKINLMATLDIRYVGIKENILLENSKNTYQNIQDNSILNEVDAHVGIVKTIMDKEEIENIIGENGNLTVLKNGDKLFTINRALINTLDELNNSDSENKSLNINEKIEIKLTNKDLEIKFTEKEEGISYLVNNAEKQGTLNIRNTAIIENNNVDRAVLKQMNNLNSKWNIKEMDNTIIKECNTNLELKETVTRANFKINNASLKGNTNNQSVEFLCLLRNDSEEYDLFNNPIVEIELPQEVENINVNQINMLYDDGLSIASNEVYDNSDGNKVIRITLQGSQTVHNLKDAIKGTYLVVNCDIKAKNNITRENGDVIFKYYNSDDVVYYENGRVSKSIKFVKTTDETTQEKEENTKTDTEDKVKEQKETQKKATTNENAAENITVTKTSSIEDGKEVNERQVIKYTIKIKNNTDEKISNIKLEDQIPEECTYAEYITSWGITKNGYEEKADVKKYEQNEIELLSKEEKEYAYNVIVNKNANNIGKSFGTKAKVTTADEKIFESNELTHKIKEGKLELRIVNFKTSEGYYSEGDEIIFFIKVKNVSNETLQNIVVKDELPAIYQFENGKILGKDANGNYDVYFGNNTEEGVSFDETTRIVKYNIAKLDKNEDAGLTVRIKLKDLDKNEFEKDIENIVSAELSQDDVYISNIEPLKLSKENYEISISSSLNEVKITEGTEFKYTITLKNTGNKELNEDIKDDLPKGISGEVIEYNIIKQNNEENTSELKIYQYNNGQAYLSVGLLPGETLIANLNVHAEALEEGVEQLEVVNYAKYGEKTTEELHNTIVKAPKQDTEQDKDKDTEEDQNKDTEQDQDKNTEQDQNKDKENQDKDPNNIQENEEKEQDSNKKYTISGIAWLDRNQNGSRDSEEPTLANIKTYLLDVNSDKQINTSVTNGKGEYSFSDVPKGKYIVLFEYDGLTYRLTDYQKRGIDETTNSDVISSFQYENNTYIGQTNTITVSNKDITNIDIGLIKTGKFDLKLDKYITNITTTTQNDTKSKDFKNATLAKAEIRSKLINGSTVTVTYNIAITNTGDVAGYAKEIIDYIPDGMNFDEKQNSGWKLQGKELKNVSLENEEILPGETKELKLVLTKTMNESNTGTFTNTAKISKSISLEKAEDNNTENDTNKANIIISISTGARIIRNTIIVLLVIAGVGILVVIKNLKERRKI